MGLNKIIMNKYLFFVLLLLVLTKSYCQYGNIELSSGGFSFIPAFMDRNPNINFAIATNSKKLISGHLIGSIRMKNISPRILIFNSRLKAIDKKFKMSIGAHLPVIQISEEYMVDTFIGQELRMSYPITEKNNLSFLYIHGKGRNNDLEFNLITINNNRQIGKFNLVSQLYFLDKDKLYGGAQTVNFKLKEKMHLKGFINYTVPTKDLFSIIGLNFNL